jgi:hypothetical protein
VAVVDVMEAQSDAGDALVRRQSLGVWLDGFGCWDQGSDSRRLWPCCCTARPWIRKYQCPRTDLDGRQGPVFPGARQLFSFQASLGTRSWTSADSDTHSPLIRDRCRRHSRAVGRRVWRRGSSPSCLVHRAVGQWLFEIFGHSLRRACCQPGPFVNMLLSMAKAGFLVGETKHRLMLQWVCAGPKKLIIALT